MKIILIICLYLTSYLFTRANSPFFISYMKVDAIEIIHHDKSGYVREQEKINEFLDSMKGTVIIPDSIGEKKFTEEHYILVFYYKEKVKKVFAYDYENKELHPSGKPLNPKLYSIISTFIDENYKEQQ